jgi:hypothetical protein
MNGASGAALPGRQGVCLYVDHGQRASILRELPDDFAG